MAIGYRVRCSIASPPSDREWTLNQLPIRVGRNALNHCQVVHPYISDFHAVVEMVEGRLCIRDLRSRNGIYAPSGERIAAEGPVPIAAMNNTFVLGRAVRMQIDEVQVAENVAAPRPAGATGTVLGNQMVLMSGLQANQPNQAKPPPGGPTPQGPGGYVPSMAGQQPNVRPSFSSQPGTGPRPAMSFTPAPGQQPVPPQPMQQPMQPQGPIQSAVPGGWGRPPSVRESGPMANYPSPAPQQPSPYDYRRTPGAAIPSRPEEEGPTTRHLAMSLEVLALQGLRELGSSLVGGAAIETTGDIARLITKLHDTVEVFCRCFVPLREGYAQFVSSMDLQRAASQRSFNRSASALRVEAGRDPAMLAASLLDWRNQDMDAPDAVAAIFADLMAHQVALVEGVMQGAQALLEELSPAHIEELAKDQPQGISSVLGKHKALWQTFQKRYEEMTSQTRTFELVFGSEFASAYREYLARQQRGGP